VMALALACWAAERPIGWAAKAWRARKRAKEHQEGDVKPGMSSGPLA